MREFLEKYGLRLLIITTACAVLISVLSFVSATSGFLQNAVGVLTYPFRSAVTAVATWAEDKQRYYKDYSDLIAENEALRERSSCATRSRMPMWMLAGLWQATKSAWLM